MDAKPRELHLLFQAYKVRFCLRQRGYDSASVVCLLVGVVLVIDVKNVFYVFLLLSRFYVFNVFYFPYVFKIKNVENLLSLQDNSEI